MISRNTNKNNLELETYNLKLLSPKKLQATSYKLQNQPGFTLVELLVVIAIIGIMATMVIANFAAQRGPRNLRIAQNELVTQIRKVQSYALSSHNSSVSGKAVKYYVLKFDKSTPTQYQVQAIASDLTFESAIETINLPTGISFGASTALQVEQPVGTTATTPSCVQVAFGLPFGKIYIDSTCDIQNVTLAPVTMVSDANAAITITLRDAASATTKNVRINGISGAITTP